MSIRFYFRLFFIAILVLMFEGVHVAWSAEAQAKDTKLNVRLRVPEKREIAAADRMVSEVYKSELADHTTKARESLIRRLLDDAIREKNDNVGRYVMLQKAGELAVSVGNVQAMIDVSKEYRTFFSEASFSIEMDAARRMIPTVQTPERLAMLAKFDLALANDLLNEERYAEIPPILQLARQAAAASHYAIISAQVANQSRYLQSICSEYARVVPALNTLQKRPDDDVANTAVGIFYCGYLGNWEKGLSHLAKGSEADLEKKWRSLAIADLASPREAKQQAELGNAWWDLAQKQSGWVKSSLESHAASWYQRAIPRLEGLSLAFAEKRVERIARTPDTYTAIPYQIVDLLAVVNPVKDSVKGRWSMDHGVLVGECRDLGLLKFPYLPPQEYDYSVELAGTSSEWLTGIQASHNDVSFQWVAGATKGGRSHLDSLEKSDVGKTESNYVMKENRTYHWRMEVRNTGIRVFVDNELVCSYATDFHEFSGLSVSKEDGKKLGVSAWWNKVEIRKAEVTEYGVPGRVTRGTP